MRPCPLKRVSNAVLTALRARAGARATLVALRAFLAPTAQSGGANRPLGGDAIGPAWSGLRCGA